jgi:hypothetical protein
MTYHLENDGAAIACHVCGSVSHNPSDVEQRYCGRCHEFHAEMHEAVKLAWSAIDEALRASPEFGAKLPLGEWARISRVLGGLSQVYEFPTVTPRASAPNRSAATRPRRASGS